VGLLLLSVVPVLLVPVLLSRAEEEGSFRDESRRASPLPLVLLPSLRNARGLFKRGGGAS
jgi:hypothetical protein